MDTLTAMRYFVRVVDSGSFSEAARQLGKSKALLSKYVAELEDELGARLMHRTTRTLSLTEVGQNYLQRSRELLREFDQLEASVRNASTEPRGELRITAPQNFGELILAPKLREFYAAYPEISIDLKLEDRFADIVNEGLDVAIRIAELSDSSLVARRLRPIRLLTYASPAYLSANGWPRQPDDLRTHQCIIDTNLSSPRSWMFRIDGERTAVNVNGPIRVNSPLAARELALAGGGIALSPDFVVTSQIADGSLVAVLESFEVYELALYIMYANRRNLSAKVRCFVDFISDSLGSTSFGSTQGHSRKVA